MQMTLIGDLESAIQRRHQPPELLSSVTIGSIESESLPTVRSAWTRGPLFPLLGENECHVWKIDLRCEMTAEMNVSLSRDEHDRAARLHLEKDRERFRTARASLRLILGRYLGLAPASLTFAQTEYGKAFLTNAEADGLLFNLSLSRDIALLAVSRDREVGIDVEFMRPDFATCEVAELFFSVAEVYTLSGLDSDVRTQAFFNCWTRKEAYIKARGEGRSLPLESFDVSLAPGLPVALLRSQFGPSELSRWDLTELFPAPEYAAALAIESGPSSPVLRQFALAE
jgi:4'-phosphopantetheinyl transferase